MLQISKDERGFLGLIGLLFTLAIICYLFYLAVNTYFRIPSLEKKREGESFRQGFVPPGYETPSYQPIMESAKSKIDAIDKQLLDRGRQIENIRSE